MNFDPSNKIIQLCAEGMNLEGQGNPVGAGQIFLTAWEASTNDFEKFTSAHYVARQQDTIEHKLKWDKTALSFALKIEDETMKAHYPSLYLNIGKCYEDLDNFDAAHKYYKMAHLYLHYLPNDGYGQMIEAGVYRGIQRVSVINEENDLKNSQ